ncbi:hypothetical protein [Bacillus thuringiensis]|uniref:hypothetical protein n=1 Tax=Bacillus thuringiensis TaxID=1428 RepID=UPI000BFC1616|nr:hypothetical protein [Bacillus thuringiensis]PGT89846.1 hypothetical protein COD17_08845 [Bacillus thuringiensis]
MERSMNLREVKNKINESYVGSLTVELYNWSEDEEQGFDLMVNILDSDGELVDDMTVAIFTEEEEKRAKAEAKKVHKNLSENYSGKKVKYTETR